MASTAAPGKSARPSRRSVGAAGDVAEMRKTPRDVPDDLLNLEDFNDSELLRALWMRYERKEIYTWVGNVLVSVNPYRDINAFSEERAARYASSQPPQAPHLFATVRAALTAEGDRHALLITGESGAGKTEATRAVLSFLAMRHSPTDYIKDRLLRSTPVLEAFGNAHTRQNTNSSRFGKFIEVQLSPALEVVGATLQPYMLEASRVAGDLPEGERTYHVFYLLREALSTLAAGTAPQSPFWTRLAHAPEWQDLARAGQAGLAASTRLDNGPFPEHCLERFEVLHEGLVKVGMKHSEVADCCRIVAAVSLLADTGLGDGVLSGVANLLRIQEDELRNFLTKAEMSVGTQRRERLHRTRSEREASTFRASLAQELYASLFGWLTRLVARGIAPSSRTLNGGRALGLLDLFGFEVFTSNGFEQFLINYCNERLQQFFNQQVFTKEAAEYAAEGLDSNGQWQRLVTACQLPALALLEGDPSTGSVGAFGVINDRSRCGFEDAKQDGGSALGQAIASTCSQQPAFRKAAIDASRAFGVAHFAGEVFYEVAQFQSKNASAHRPDIVVFLKEQGCPFVRDVITGDAEVQNRDASPMPQSARSPSRDGPNANASRRKLFGRTLISVFREELNELCTTLEARECRHVRCLRPNDEQAPLVFDDESMLRQCRYSGLLEATRIRRQGYAHRRPLRSFAVRFALLLGTREARRVARHVPSTNAAMACSAILQAASEAGISTEDARIGYTKVFLRETALVWFETARRRVAEGLIAALLLGHHTRQYYCRLRKAVRKAQAITRGRRDRDYVRRLRAEIRAAEERAAAERRAARLRAIEEANAQAARESAEGAAVARAITACCVLQRWWRQRFAYARSSSAAAWREQEEHRRCEQQPWVDEVVVLLAPHSQKAAVSGSTSPEEVLRSYSGDWPASVPGAAAAEQLAERRDHGEQGGCSGRGAGKEAAHGDDQLRKACKQAARSAKASKDGKPKKQGGGNRREVGHEVGGRGQAPTRTTSPASHSRMEPRSRIASHKVGSGPGSGRLPPSPRSLRRCYRQEIARLLAQHKQLRRRLPAELRDLPAQLMEAAQALGQNEPNLPPEVLLQINESLHTLKAALKEHTGAASAHHPVAEPPHHNGSEMHVVPPTSASAPALHRLAFHAPPIDEQQCGLRHSSSARSVPRPISPRPSGCRSPIRSPPMSARTPTGGFRTPIRGPAKILGTRVGTPVATTPRQVCYSTAADGAPGTPTASVTVPVWAWPPKGAEANSHSQRASFTVPCATTATYRKPSPVVKSREPARFPLGAIPTPSRSSRGLTSPHQTVRVPIVQATPTAAAIAMAMAAPKVGAPSVAAPMSPVAMTTSPVISPGQSPPGTPGAPPPGTSPPMAASNSSPAFVVAFKPAPAESTLPTWQGMSLSPVVGGVGPSRCSSPCLRV